MRFHFFITTLLASNISWAIPSHPPCDGVERWAAQTALVALKNLGLIKDFSEIYDGQTATGVTSKLLEAKKIGAFPTEQHKNSNLFRLTQTINVKTKTNKRFELMVISEASNFECSMNAPTIILLSPQYKVLGTGDSALQSAPQK